MMMIMSFVDGWLLLFLYEKKKIFIYLFESISLISDERWTKKKKDKQTKKNQSNLKSIEIFKKWIYEPEQPEVEIIKQRILSPLWKLMCFLLRSFVGQQQSNWSSQERANERKGSEFFLSFFSYITIINITMNWRWWWSSSRPVLKDPRMTTSNNLVWWWWW